ncbi:MAG: ribonuclease P protein component [Putridiphycobacter sp.]
MENPTKPFSFKKEEKLRSKKLIEALFADGKKLKQFPFKLVYLEVTDDNWHFPAQIVISVPKKIIKKAHKRNRLKRQIREAYRTQKPEFYGVLQSKEKKLALFLIYTGKEKVSFQDLEEKLSLLLNKLQNTI